MSITSFTFFLFVFISLFLYYITPKKYSYITLLLSSLIFIFYNSLTLSNIIIILTILSIAYISGFLINRFKNSIINKIIFIISIISILIILIYLKYSNIFISLFNLDIKVTISSPLGITYFALIIIGYIIDIYWGICDKETNPFKLLLFMIYYPILTSGPFIKYNEIDNELFVKNKFNMDNILSGFLRMLIGIFKVLVLSSRLGIIVNYVYGSLDAVNGLLVLIAIFTYTLELYTNFSGSIDIIIGLSNMYGIKLPENFDNPFLATSITEFWRKWHITLGVWLKNYIFYPLCKSNIIQKLTEILKKKLRPKTVKKIILYICLLVLWTTIGIWHGGKLKFIIASGLLQYLFIVTENLFEPLMKKQLKSDNKILKVIKIARVFILFSLSMVFFRADTIEDGLNIFAHLFNNGSLNLLNIITMIDLIILILGIAIMFIFEYKREENINLFNKISIDKKLLIIFTLILIILVLGHYGIGFNNEDFIYSRF